MNKPFAEIIQSSLQTFTGQCWQWDQIPQFGSLVRISSGNRIIVGIVYQIQTGSMDPTRYPFTYQKTHEQLRAEQPQIFEFLKTTFSCIALGYTEHDKTYYLIPPEPPAIHSFIVPLSQKEAHEYCNSSHYLHLIFGANIPCLDELLLALLHHQFDHSSGSSAQLEEFIHTYSLLIGNDYRRLKLFLQRAQGIIASQ